jgi:selenocysteine lyase/cysteine desulfurase
MSPLVTFSIEGVDSGWICGALSEAGFAVRGGLHCAPGAHAAAGTLPWGAVRVSPGVFTTMLEMKDFSATLDTILREKPI